MKTAKDIAIIGVYLALMIGSQFLFSAIMGIEIITVLLLAFAFRFGIIKSTLLSTAFSLLRCFLFGFNPTVIILYLVYYNLFAITVGGIGNFFERKYSVRKNVILVCVAVLLTLCFTLLDDLITPLFYGYTLEAWKGYFISSLAVMLPQVICVIITCALLFKPLLMVFDKINIK